MNIDKIEEILNKNDKYLKALKIYKESLKAGDKFTQATFKSGSNTYINNLICIYKEIYKISNTDEKGLKNCITSIRNMVKLNDVIQEILNDEINKLKKIINDKIVFEAEYQSVATNLYKLKKSKEEVINYIKYYENENLISSKNIVSEKNLLSNNISALNSSLNDFYNKFKSDIFLIKVTEMNYKDMFEQLYIEINSIYKTYPVLKDEVSSIMRIMNIVIENEKNIEKIVETIDSNSSKIMDYTLELTKIENNLLILCTKDLKRDEFVLFEKDDIFSLEKYIELIKENNVYFTTLYSRAEDLNGKITSNKKLSSNIVSNVMNNILIQQGNSGDSIYDVNDLFGADEDYVFGVNSYNDVIDKESDSYMQSWYKYLNDLLENPQREFIIDKNNITNFKIVFRNQLTGLSTEKESIVQLNHTISSRTNPIFAIGRNTYQTVSKGVKLMAGTIVVNAFENVPLAHLHSISYSKDTSPESLPPIDMYIIPIENLNDGRFEALLIKGIKFIDMRQTDGASSGGRYYAFNFIAKNFIPTDFSNLDIR
ncbi:MAG: hypothetical protein ACRC4T_28315 [Cetobacterium sp.]